METIDKEFFNGKLCYLAHPFSSDEIGGERINYEDVTNIAANLFDRGYTVYSPITHCYPIKLINGKQWDFWMCFDSMLMSRCDILILCPNWENSRGCNEEKRIFEEQGKPWFLLGDLP